VFLKPKVTHNNLSTKSLLPLSSRKIKSLRLWFCTLWHVIISARIVLLISSTKDCSHLC